MAAGTYRPDQGIGITLGDREATFQLMNNVAVYGGFPSGGGEWWSRNPITYKSTLSGDLNSDDGPDFTNYSENSYHIVTGSATDATAILDGFTIKGGNADGASPHEHGGGMYNSGGNPTIDHCTFKLNSASSTGGGMYNFGANPSISYCDFQENIANYGGGMSNRSYSNPDISHCTFVWNSANYSGGGICNWPYSDPIIVCCIFIYNSSKSYGGGIDNYNHSNANIDNCIFWGNTAPEGLQMSVRDKSTVSVGYCDVQGGNGDVYVDGGTVVWNSGNIDTDPLFVDADGFDGQYGTHDDDLRLLDGSPCIDAGDNTAIPADITDLDGDDNTTETLPFDLSGLTLRINDCSVADTGQGTPPIVDMGAYEHAYPCDINFSGSVDFKDFSILAKHWLEINCGSCDGADLTGDRGVAVDDLKEFTYCWLAGN